MFRAALVGVVAIAAAAAPRAVSAEVNRPLLLAAGGSELPLVRGALDVQVRGPIARLHLTQTFHNPATEPIEAVYVFPLPHDGAVGGMTMRVGSRTIRAAIKRRDEARDIYEKARRDGKVAALLDQERPNVFTQAVANLEPGAEIDVAVDVDVLLAPDDGVWELALPTVVGPRYTPGVPLDGPSVGTGVAPDTDAVPDASRVTPSAVPRDVTTGNTLAVAIDLEAGAPITELTSPTHRIAVAARGPTRRAITLADGAMIRDSDLVVRWRTDVTEPTAAVFAHRAGDVGHLALLLTPPRLGPAPTQSRELVFVVDTSGSMEGQPLGLARTAMRHALSRLRPDDSFRIITFSSHVDGFEGGAVQIATRDNVHRGLAFVDGLVPDGGTEMLPGIRAALAQEPAPGRSRYVVVMSDGLISNEREILDEIRRGAVRRTRVFGFGVGNSVNRYLLDTLASAGHGTSQYLLLDQPAAPQVERFYRRLDTAVLEGLTIDWGGLDVKDVEPAGPIELFGDQPLVVVARYRGPSTGLRANGPFLFRLRGVSAGRNVLLEVPVELPAVGAEGDGDVVDRLWARRRIAALSERTDRSDPDLVGTITGIALAYSLASEHTSFVAVEDRVVNQGGVQQTIEVPVDMARGVSDGDDYYPGAGGEVVQIEGRASVVDYSDTVLELGGAVPVPARGRFALAAAGGYGRGGGLLALSAAYDHRVAGNLGLGLDLGLLARLDERLVGTLSATFALWQMFGLVDLQVGLGAGLTRDDAGLAWHAALAAPLGSKAMGPALVLRVDHVAVGDDPLLGGTLGLRWRF